MIRDLLNLNKYVNDIFAGRRSVENLRDSGRCWARAAQNNNQSIPNATGTVIDYHNKLDDPFGAISGTGTNWRFTVPANQTGLYLVTAAAVFSPGAGAHDPELQLIRPGVEQIVMTVGQMDTALSGISGATVRLLQAGEQWAISLYQASGGARLLEPRFDFNHVTFTRLLSPY